MYINNALILLMTGNSIFAGHQEQSLQLLGNAMWASVKVSYAPRLYSNLLTHEARYYDFSLMYISSYRVAIS